MALSLVQITILAGAGIAGSILAAKEGAPSTVSDLFSGAAKIVWRQIRNDSSTSPVKKPQNDALMSQVNSLRQELQLMSSNKPVTIITTSGTGSSKYGVVIVIVVVGYGYVWWKGWKLPDMMFATRRSLSDACNSVSKQLENVYSSIAATKQKLSSRIDRVDSSLDNVARVTSATKEQVSELRGKAEILCFDVNSVRHAVKNLETKINRIEVLQDATNSGVKKLCGFASTIEKGGANNRVQALPSNYSRPTIELLPTPSPKGASSPASVLSLESPSPSESSGSPKVQQPLQTAVSASGFKEINGMLEGAQTSSSRPEFSINALASDDKVNGSSSSGLFGLKFPGMNASFLSRAHSVAASFKLSNNAA